MRSSRKKRNKKKGKSRVRRAHEKVKKKKNDLGQIRFRGSLSPFEDETSSPGSGGLSVS